MLAPSCSALQGARTPLAAAVVVWCPERCALQQRPLLLSPAPPLCLPPMHPLQAQYLADLGVTAVELLPVRAFALRTESQGVVHCISGSGALYLGVWCLPQ